MKYKNINYISVISILLITIVSLILLHTEVKETYIKRVVSKQINMYIDRTSKINDKKTTINNKDERYKYIAVLEIPTINLSQGLLSLSNKYNNVEYNIEIIKGSEMPNIPQTNLVLASHSGTSKISFFKNLEKLQANDNVYIYYEGYKYIYKLDEYYVLPKTGIISIYRDKYKNTITLITCKKDNDIEQIAYIGYLIAKEVY